MSSLGWFRWCSKKLPCFFRDCLSFDDADLRLVAMARRSKVQKLEHRDLLATAVWHNPVFGSDSTGD